MPTFSKLVGKRRKMCTNKILGSLEFLAIKKLPRFSIMVIKLFGRDLQNLKFIICNFIAFKKKVLQVAGLRILKVTRLLLEGRPRSAEERVVPD